LLGGLDARHGNEGLALDVEHDGGGGRAGIDERVPSISRDLDIGDEVDIVGPDSDGIDVGEGDVVVDDGDAGGECVNLERGKTVDGVLRAKHGEIVVVVETVGGAAGSLNEEVVGIEERVVHVDTRILELSSVPGGICAEIEDSSDHNSNLDVLQLAAEALHQNSGASKGESTSSTRRIENEVGSSECLIGIGNGGASVSEKS
jgi:hypothetical protein